MLDLSAADPDVLVLVGTQTGNSELVADAVAERFGALGFAAHVLDLAEAVPDELADHRQLVVVLFAVWGFGALMTVEFGIREWLSTRPVAVLLSHALIVPFIDFFAVSADVLGNGADYPEGVGWLIGVSLYGGMAVEVGRKIWSPADERRGVVSYSDLWGVRPALVVWALVVALSAACGIFVLRAIARSAVGLAAVGLEAVQIGLAIAALVVIAAAAVAMRGALPGRGRVVETLAGVWTLALYLSIGPLALWLSRV